MSVEELERVVTTLKPDELTEFSSWFEDYIADQWDKKFKSDVEAGKLDHLADKVDRDFDAGKCSEL